MVGHGETLQARDHLVTFNGAGGGVRDKRGGQAELCGSRLFGRQLLGSGPVQGIGLESVFCTKEKEDSLSGHAKHNAICLNT